LGSRPIAKLRDSNDAVIFVTGSLAHDVHEAWSNFLHDSLATAPERMAARLSPPAGDDGSQSSSLQRALFESFACPEELRSSGDTGNVAAIQLMCHVRLLHFDYEAVPSRDHALALTECQRLLRSGEAAEAERLWDRLIGIADAKRAGGTINLPQLLAELRGEFELRDHPDYRRDAESLERLSSDLMADVRTQIAGLPPLPRVADRATVENCLDRHRACLLVGESGCGKSALAKEIGRARYPRVVWIAENTLDYDTAAEFERGINIGHPLVEVLTPLPEPCLVVLDGIDRYSPRALRLASHFLQALLADDGPQHVRVLVTAQFETANRLIRRFIELGVPPSLHTATPIDQPAISAKHRRQSRAAGGRWRAAYSYRRCSVWRDRRAGRSALRLARRRSRAHGLVPPQA
jgi:hypothetical protein